MFIKVILMIVCGVLAKAEIPDPLCERKACTKDTSCRVFLECALPGLCDLTAKCVGEVANSLIGQCQVGQPILQDDGTGIADVTCYPGSPCPDSTYCNALLQDTYAFCCSSNPSDSVKTGVCPPSTDDIDTSSCIRYCNNDSDCGGDDKCCEHGCNRECTPPLL